MNSKNIPWYIGIGLIVMACITVIERTTCSRLDTATQVIIGITCALCAAYGYLMAKVEKDE